MLTGMYYHASRRSLVSWSLPVVLAATFEGNACKGTWVLREKASGNPALDGTWSVAKK